MMKASPFFLLISLGIFFSFPAPVVADGDDSAVLRSWAVWYKTHDPVARAAEDFARGRTHVISAMGYSNYFPGLEHAVGEHSEKRYGSKPLVGVTDTAGNEVERAFREAALSFAKAYNQATVKLLKEAGHE